MPDKFMLLGKIMIGHLWHFLLDFFVKFGHKEP